ncbi:MAG: hypothetical protein ACR2OZ_13410 [Verrucomicrobiales bacterium]
MTLEELGRRVWEGRLIVAGELRACRAEESGWVDKKTGLASPSLRITYVVECQRERGLENVKVSRFFPAPYPELAVICEQVRKGLRYAFECLTVKRDEKTGLITATMDAVDPVALDGVGSPTPAPAGAGVGGGGA